MAAAKTTESDGAAAFLAAVQPEGRRAEAQRLDAIFRDVTGYAPRLWAGSMLGYGRYAYRYDSGQAGVSLATGFAPRKAELVLYVLPDGGDVLPLLARLGPHRQGKSCLYLKRLAGVDEGVLCALIRDGLDDLASRWTVEPT